MPYCNVDGCREWRVSEEAMRIHIETMHQNPGADDKEAVVGKLQLAAPANKACPNKRCEMRNTVKYTRDRLCGVCGTKLLVEHGKTEAVHPAVISISDNGAANPTLGLPAAEAEEYVLRAHYTVWKGNTSVPTWECWCGYTTTDRKESYDHDALPPTKFKKADLPWGARYKTLDAKPTQTDDWTCSPDIKGCPLLNENTRPRIEVDEGVWEKWIKTAGRVSTEWLAYLIGEPIEPSEKFPKGGWKVTDFYFPRQRVTGAHVTVNEEDLRNLRPGTIGDVHSHVRMNAYFSQEDEKHFNHDLHIVINARNDFDISVRVKLDCGRTSRSKGALYLVGEDKLADLLNMLQEKFEADPPAQPLSDTSQNASPNGNVPTPSASKSGGTGHNSGVTLSGDDDQHYLWGV